MTFFLIPLVLIAVPWIVYVSCWSFSEFLSCFFSSVIVLGSLFGFCGWQSVLYFAHSSFLRPGGFHFGDSVFALLQSVRVSVVDGALSCYYSVSGFLCASVRPGKVFLYNYAYDL